MTALTNGPFASNLGTVRLVDEADATSEATFYPTRVCLEVTNSHTSARPTCLNYGAATEDAAAQLLACGALSVARVAQELHQSTVLWFVNPALVALPVLCGVLQLALAAAIMSHFPCCCSPETAAGLEVTASRVLGLAAATLLGVATAIWVVLEPLGELVRCVRGLACSSPPTPAWRSQPHLRMPSLAGPVGDSVQLLSDALVHGNVHGSQQHHCQPGLNHR